MSKTIVIPTDEIPCRKDLVDTVSRLKKDYELLRKIRGTKDVEDPEAIIRVANFLAGLVQRGRRKINKERDDEDPNQDTLLQLLTREYQTLDKERLVSLLRLIEEKENAAASDNS